ncbi:voltage-dependent calcium channel subunit alpha-2/delta-4-like isoform X5, partial [Scomber scombrus]
MMMSSLSSSQCTLIEGVCPLSCESADLNCFLVDNNGFIVLSKERNEQLLHLLTSSDCERRAERRAGRCRSDASKLSLEL